MQFPGVWHWAAVWQLFGSCPVGTLHFSQGPGLAPRGQKLEISLKVMQLAWRVCPNCAHVNVAGGILDEDMHLQI
jgi:hypothetical protein